MNTNTALPRHPSGPRRKRDWLDRLASGKVCLFCLLATAVASGFGLLLALRRYPALLRGVLDLDLSQVASFFMPAAGLALITTIVLGLAVINALRWPLVTVGRTLADWLSKIAAAIGWSLRYFLVRPVVSLSRTLVSVLETMLRLAGRGLEILVIRPVTSLARGLFYALGKVLSVIWRSLRIILLQLLAFGRRVAFGALGKIASAFFIPAIGFALTLCLSAYVWRDSLRRGMLWLGQAVDNLLNLFKRMLAAIWRGLKNFVLRPLAFIFRVIGHVLRWLALSSLSVGLLLVRFLRRIGQGLLRLLGLALRALWFGIRSLIIRPLVLVWRAVVYLIRKTRHLIWLSLKSLFRLWQRLGAILMSLYRQLTARHILLFAFIGALISGGVGLVASLRVYPDWPKGDPTFDKVLPFFIPAIGFIALTILLSVYVWRGLLRRGMLRLGQAVDNLLNLFKRMLAAIWRGLKNFALRPLAFIFRVIGQMLKWLAVSGWSVGLLLVKSLWRVVQGLLYLLSQALRVIWFGVKVLVIQPLRLVGRALVYLFKKALHLIRWTLTSLFRLLQSLWAILINLYRQLTARHLLLFALVSALIYWLLGDPSLDKVIPFFIPAIGFIALVLLLSAYVWRDPLRQGLTGVMQRVGKLISLAVRVIVFVLKNFVGRPLVFLWKFLLKPMLNLTQKVRPLLVSGLLILSGVAALVYAAIQIMRVIGRAATDLIVKLLTALGRGLVRLAQNTATAARLHPRAVMTLTLPVVLLFGGLWLWADGTLCLWGFEWACQPSPPPPPLCSPAAPSGALEICVVTSGTKADWVRDTAKTFNAAQFKIASGKPISVTVAEADSGDFLSGLREGRIVSPTVWSPGEISWVSEANVYWQGRYGKLLAIEPQCSPTVYAIIGIGMWKPMAEAMGWPNEPISWDQFVELTADPQGWARYGHPEWGQFKFGHTHPGYSNTGFLAMASLVYNTLDRTDGLTPEMVKSPAVVEAFRQLELHTYRYGTSTRSLFTFMATKGPDYLHAGTNSESGVFATNKFNKDTLPFPLIFIIPADGAFWSENPYCVIDEAWVTAEQREAAQIYKDYLLAPEQQDRAMDFGLRPTDPTVPLRAPMTADWTDVRATPKTVPRLESVSGEAAAAIKDVFQQTKKKATIVVVLDASGSMQGEKMTNAVEASANFLKRLNKDDEVVVFAFGDTVTELQPSGRAGDVAEALDETLRALPAQGRTALYDAICAGTDRLAQLKTAHEAEGEQRLYGLVILSDGQDTASRKSQDFMYICLPRGGEVGDAKVFTIAYGVDADKELLEDIAKRTSGRAFSGDPATIEQVYLAISAEQ